jgi:hypothetical protein
MAAPATPAPPATPAEPDPNSLHAQLERFTNIFEENPEDLSEVRVPWEGPPPWGPHELLDGQSFKDIANKYRTLPSFLPRKGELVLFYPVEQLNCRFEYATQHFKIFDEDSGDFVGFPAWKAGVITAEPEEPLGHEDLSPLPYCHLEVTNKSYRIELYPDPDSKDKSLSHQAYQIPLNRIRPLSMFHEFLSGVSQSQWHVSIHNAMKVMNTVCFVDPIGFAGKWFSYSVRCRGVWIGAELFINGDAVRLLPVKENDNQVDQVMIISRIDHRFENDDIHDERSSIVVAGPVLTINKNRSFQNTPFTVAEKQELPLPASTAGYSWYPIDVSIDGHPPEANHEGFLDDWQEIPMSFIVGRLYDAKAMKSLLDINNFDVGGLGMKQARRWAKQHRTNMRVNTRQGWILTVDRVQALDIETLNERAVGRGVERENVRARNGNHPRPGQGVSSSGRTHVNRGLLSSGSSCRSAMFNGNGSNNEPDDEKRSFEEVMDAGGPGNIDEDTQSDNDGHPLRNMKSVVTDRTTNWSETEDENAENFISDVIAGNVLPTSEEGMDEDSADEDREGGHNGDNPDRQRPPKRPRF